MTPTRRWQSFKKAVWLSVGLALSSLLLSWPWAPTISHGSFLWASWAVFSFFPFILWTWTCVGELWGLGTASIAVILVALGALAARKTSYLWLVLEFFLFGFVVHRGLGTWREALQACRLRSDHLEEEGNTLDDELKHLQEVKAGLLARLTRYQQLRHIANSFSASLQLSDLSQRIVQAIGEVIDAADVALLYLVNPQTLQLELHAVWRRQGHLPIKTKQGDPFDHWVMRHGQPLHVEEPADDFRFSHEVQGNLERPLGALVAVPLVNEIRLMGVLRVESAIPRSLGAEDLRLTRIIGDLASLGIENSRLYNRMAELSITDDLTGLSVRSYFQKRFQEEIARAKRVQMPISLLLIDIDQFKSYNDTFGHTAGDKCLKHIAQILGEGRRPGDLVARYGGEEFVCLLPGVETQDALRLAEGVRCQVERTQLELRRFVARFTVSIGAATFPKDGTTPDELFKKADERLYRAKELGRNRVCAL